MLTYFALASFLAIAYTYISYPLLLLLANFIRGRSENPTEAAGPWPNVAVIVTLHNGFKLIHGKMANLAIIDYPGQVSIHFVLDGCTDGTETEINRWKELCPGFDVFVHATSGRVGKEQAIRNALPSIREDVLMFTDGDAEFQPQTIFELVRTLRQDRVGVACGLETHLTREGTGAGSGEGIYYRYENMIKSLQDKLTSLSYIQGGVFAMWRNLYPPTIPAGATQDGTIAFHAVLSGYRVAFSPRAKSMEYYDYTTAADFSRRVRTISRAFYAICCAPSIFNPLRTGWYGFHVMSGRIFRWMTIPFFLVGVFLLIPGLLAGQTLACIVFTLACLWVVATIIGFLMERKGIRLKLPYFCFYFSYIHLAAIVAICRVILGKRVATWSPTGIILNKNELGTGKLESM